MVLWVLLTAVSFYFLNMRFFWNILEIWIWIFFFFHDCNCCTPSWIKALSWERHLHELWAILCRPTQDRSVIVKSSDKMWSTGESNGKPLQYSYCKNHKEGWAPKIDVFELWYWIRLLRVTWTIGRLNQWMLKEINPGYSLEGLMLKMKLQYFGHLMRRTNS